MSLEAPRLSCWGIVLALAFAPIIAGATPTEGCQTCSSTDSLETLEGEEIAKLEAAGGTGFSDKVGSSVAISGSTLVTGVRRGGLSGEAYVFVKPPGGWTSGTETAKLTPSELRYDFFGYSVGISGDTVVVGAPDDTGAYVFVEPPGGWVSATETAVITPSDGFYPDLFGFSAAASGDTIVVGAPGAGAAYVFVKPPGGWVSTTETAKLTASDAGPDDRVGLSVAIDGDTVIVGASGAFGGGGGAYVFVKPPGGWVSATETAKLVASDLERVGLSVAIDGGTVVATSASGPAYVFVEPPGGWASATETARLTPSDGLGFNEFGVAVSISGPRVVVGGPGTEVDGDYARGTAYLFLEPPGGWVSATENARLIASDGEEYTYLGAAVAISGTTVFAGAPYADLIAPGPDFDGSVYVFDTAQTTVDVPALTPAGIAILALLLSVAAAWLLRKPVSSHSPRARN